MGNERLSGRNAAIANIFTDSEQLKHYYRFTALNPHINLHDACNILLARPNAMVCYPYEEWNELGRQVIRGKKSIAYYDYDGYKQFVFDVSDTRGDSQFNCSLLPMERLSIGLNELNGTDLAGANNNGYKALLDGIKVYLHGQGITSGNEPYDVLLAEGIAYSLYAKTGLPEDEQINLQALPFSFKENAEFVKEVYIQTIALAQEIEDAYRNKQEEIKIIDDTEEETFSDEPILSEPVKTVVETHSAIISNYKGYDVLLRWINPEKTDREAEVYLGKKENYDNKGHYDNFDNSLVLISKNEKMFEFLHPSEWVISQQEMIDKGYFTEEDYKEFYDLGNGILKGFEKISEIKFSVDVNVNGSGVPFKYPNWQSEQIADNTEQPQLTPYYQKYKDAQQTNPKAIVVIRNGDFYEMMGESAKIVSKELGLTLTGREVGLPERVPMCGIPYHALDTYLNKILVNHGVLLIDGEEEPTYILSHAEALEQAAESKKEFNFKDIKIRELSIEHSLFSENDEQKIIDFYNNTFLLSFPETRNEITELTKTSKAFSKLTDAEKEIFVITRDMFTYFGQDASVIEDLHTAINQKYEMICKLVDNAKPQPKLTEIDSEEPSPFDDEQSDDWRNELAEELGELSEEQLDEDEDLKQEEKPIAESKQKLTQKKPEKGIKDRKRKAQPQSSLFDLFEPQEKSREEQLIEQHLKGSSSFQHGKFRIFDKYNENPSEKAFVEFLKKEYGEGGSYVGNIDESHSRKGISLKWVDKENPDSNLDIFLKWTEVAVRVADLIDDDNYLTEQEKKLYIEYKVEQNRLREQRAEEERKKNEFINLVITSTDENRKQRILDEYAKTTVLTDFANFLCAEYGYSLEANAGYHAKYDVAGVWLSKYDDKGNTEIRTYLKWEEFADKVCTLIENDRYITYKPEAQLSPEQQKINDIVGSIVKEGLKNTADGKWFNYFEDYKDDKQFVMEHKHEIAQQLVSRKEVAQVGMDDISIDTTFNLEYCSNYDWDADGEEEEQDEKTDLTSVLNQGELGGAKTRFRNNVEAIKLVNRLYASNRNPTETEKKVLAQFVGWGGLSQAFDEKNKNWQKELPSLKRCCQRKIMNRQEAVLLMLITRQKTS